MAAPRTWTTDDDATLATLHGQGMSLHAIAKEMGRGKATISRKAAEQDPPLTWDRAQVANATQAKVADAKARRAQLKADLLDDAARLRKQLWQQTTYVDHGGKDFDEVEWTLDEPIFADKLRIMQAVSTAVGSYDRLEKLDGDQGTIEAVGMLDKIADAIKAAAEHMAPPEEP